MYILQKQIQKNYKQICIYNRNRSRKSINRYVYTIEIDLEKLLTDMYIQQKQIQKNYKQICIYNRNRSRKIIIRNVYTYTRNRSRKIINRYVYTKTIEIDLEKV